MLPVTLLLAAAAVGVDDDGGAAAAGCSDVDEGGDGGDGGERHAKRGSDTKRYSANLRLDTQKNWSSVDHVCVRASNIWFSWVKRR